MKIYDAGHPSEYGSEFDWWRNRALCAERHNAKLREIIDYILRLGEGLGNATDKEIEDWIAEARKIIPKS